MYNYLYKQIKERAMFNNEEYLLREERIQFDLEHEPAAGSKKSARPSAIVMIFNDPIPLGQSGFGESVLVTDKNGSIRGLVR